jgi:hypothetical protein
MNPSRLALFLVSLALRAPATAPAQQEFRPVDQAVQQPEFFAFRARLQTAVARRDTAAVLAVLHPGVRNTFGGEGGVQEFREAWHLEAPDSRLWPTLAAVLAWGGSFGADGSFTAPYVSSCWPADLDGFEYIAVVGDSARVRSQPDSSGTLLANLGFSIVPVGDVEDRDAAWLPVRLADGRSGYVDRRCLRGPADYRAVFAKLDGRWQLTALIAGD